MRDVDSWARQAIGRLQADPLLAFETEHIDRLLGQAWRQSDAVPIGHTAYEQLLRATLHQSQTLQATLVFPLDYSQKLVTDPPALDALDSHLRTVEPPSLYLIRRTSLARWNSWEEYRVPIEQDIHHPETGGVRAHYSCHRDAEERARGWEFGRAIYFDHFTDSLLHLEIQMGRPGDDISCSWSGAESIPQTRGPGITHPGNTGALHQIVEQCDNFE